MCTYQLNSLHRFGSFTQEISIFVCSKNFFQWFVLKHSLTCEATEFGPKPLTSACSRTPGHYAPGSGFCFYLRKCTSYCRTRLYVITHMTLKPLPLSRWIWPSTSGQWRTGPGDPASGERGTQWHREQRWQWDWILPVENAHSISLCCHWGEKRDCNAKKNAIPHLCLILPF